jgi:hypothetical protein
MSNYAQIFPLVMVDCDRHNAEKQKKEAMLCITSFF